MMQLLDTIAGTVRIADSRHHLLQVPGQCFAYLITIIANIDQQLCFARDHVGGISRMESRYSYHPARNGDL
ncbi:hypothetical protein A8U91_03733 [Halomonas elongata]|uniref:Uncharacterized protein n=1 Tax=Halomonas elongata TaxID=2746 RepID=A0A1B8NXH5_HALEL|nr:hypothetical protein A8U91_03733 [Halomonas elongata]